MDYVLNFADSVLLTPVVYGDNWPEEDIWRQFISLFVIVLIGGYIMYFVPSSLSFYFLYDHNLMKHPLFLKNQIRREIKCAVMSLLIMAFFTTIVFLVEVRGYSQLYDNISDSYYGWWNNIFNVVTFIMFTDTIIYWCHRWFHWRHLYKYLHKVHHTWKVPTPFASHAFHPLDGFLQSLAYHLYVFLFPMHKLTYLVLFFLVNIWTVSIHDGNYDVPLFLRPFINGAAHHMDHHVFYNCNYGQFFTFWDRVGGSFQSPKAFEGKGPSFEVGNGIKEWKQN